MKYRTKQIEGKDAAELGQSTPPAFMSQLNNHALIAEDGKYGVADGNQAVKVARAHATECGFSPESTFAYIAALSRPRPGRFV